MELSGAADPVSIRFIVRQIQDNYGVEQNLNVRFAAIGVAQIKQNRTLRRKVLRWPQVSLPAQCGSMINFEKLRLFVLPGLTSL